MIICVVGTGYVGLVTGSCLAELGMKVVCIDKDKEKIEQLKNGQIPIYEQGLGELIEQNTEQNRLSFSVDLETAVKKSEVIFLGVGTPGKEDGSTDMSFIKAAAVEIAQAMNDYKLVVIKSTVPVGSSKMIRELIEKNQTTQVDFDIVSNPEFLREGTAVHDFMNPDRIVVGTDSNRAFKVMENIYGSFIDKDIPLIKTSNETAELIKYASNSALALKISFINEIANLCERTGADVKRVAEAIGIDDRIGSKFLRSGPGFGGSCLPKDVSALVQIAKEHDYKFLLGEAMVEINRRQKELVVKKCEQILDGLEGKTISLLGLAFKPNTDDVRESPSLFVAKQLLDAKATIKAYDPAAMDEAKKNIEGINYCLSVDVACRDSDLILVMTEWDEFRELDWSSIKQKVKQTNIYDTRNIYDSKVIRDIGFNYYGTGRPKE